MDLSSVFHGHHRSPCDALVATSGRSYKTIPSRRSGLRPRSYALFQPLWTDNEHVLTFVRRRHDGYLLVLANPRKYPQSLQGDLSHHTGLSDRWIDVLANGAAAGASGCRIWRWPYALRWLVNEGDP
jgi:amylosucrase